MDGPSAINRLGIYGVPAIAACATSSVAECVQSSISAIMDSSKLTNTSAVDQLHPLLSGLSALVDKLGRRHGFQGCRIWRQLHDLEFFI